MNFSFLCLDIQENGDLKAAVIRNFSACASKLRTCNFLRVLYLVSMEEKKSLTDGWWINLSDVSPICVLK